MTVFDRLSDTAEGLMPLVELASSVGLITVLGALLLAVLKRNAESRRWRNFKQDLEGWARALVDYGDRHPKELRDEDWRAECEVMLYDSGFTPSEISEILDLAIIVAKATTIDILDLRQS